MYNIYYYFNSPVSRKDYCELLLHVSFFLVQEYSFSSTLRNIILLNKMSPYSNSNYLSSTVSIV